MSHLNYFLPFSKGTENHEDHLTRAFLVLLKHSDKILQHFYSYVFQQTFTIDREPFKPLYQSSMSDIQFQTQVGSLPIADTYVSILITDDNILLQEEIKCVERIPIYDGVINFNNELVFFIECKLNKDGVWEQQLCPAKKDIPEDAILINKAAVLEWKEIINNLHRINNSNITSYRDKILISDFFELINLHFDYLNPYNDFSKCHTSYLAGKRIEQLLKDVCANEEKVKHHMGWGHYIELDFDEIRKIAVLLNGDINGNWTGITITADFGSIVSQARAFYSRINYDIFIEKLNDFKVSCDLHLAIQSQNVVFFESPINSLNKYFEFWKSDVVKHFGGVPKDELESIYLHKYAEVGIITYDLNKQKEVKSTILNKGYQRVNICPAILVEYFISKEDAMKLDKNNLLANKINGKMREILNVLDYSLEEVYKKLE